MTSDDRKALFPFHSGNEMKNKRKQFNYHLTLEQKCQEMNRITAMPNGIEYLQFAGRGTSE